MNSKTKWVLFLLLLSCWVPSVQSMEAKTNKKLTKKKPSAELVVDYGDGAQKRFPSVPWTKGMTVLDALQWADDHPHGIELQCRGKGSLALVGKIDDLKNSGGTGKNWIFYVNQKLSQRGCGATEIAANDQILWRYEVYK